MALERAGVVIFGGASESSYQGKWTDLLESSIAARVADSKKLVFNSYPADDNFYDYDKPSKDKNVEITRNTETMYQSILSQLNSQLGGLNVDYDDIKVYYDYDADLPLNTVYKSDQEEVAANSKANEKKTSEAIFAHLDASVKSVFWSGSDITDGDMVNAKSPSVVIMEEAPRDRGYGRSGGSASIREAYILTSLAEDSYGNQPSGVPGHALIQGAYWITKSNYSLSDGMNHIVSGSSNLAQKGKDYESFRSTYGSNSAYKKSIKIDTSKSRIAAHRDKQTLKIRKENVTFENGYYIVGPVKIKYPQFEDFSYLKTMTLTAINEDNEETKLRYGYKSGGTIDKDYKQFYLDFDTAVKADKANGLSTVFPTSGENFYIIFGAKEANYPVRIKLEVQAEYLADVSASLTNNKAEAAKYTYEGRTFPMTAEENSSFPMKRQDKRWTRHEYIKVDGVVQTDDDGNKKTNDYPNQVWSGISSDDGYEDNEHVIGSKYTYHTEKFAFHLRARVYYVGMKSSADSRQEGQPLDTVSSGSRTYKTVAVEAEITPTPTPPSESPPVSPPVSEPPDTPETPETPPSSAPPTTSQPPTSGPPTSETPDTPGTPTASPPTPPSDTPEWDNLTIGLGGYVWYDAKSGKAVVTDGLNNFNTTDKPIPNMRVYLYRYKTAGTQNANSRQNPETAGLDEHDYYKTTTTNSNGYYKFEGLNAMYQYFVEFEYNGMYYEPVEEANGTSSFNIIYDQTNLSQDVLNSNETLHSYWKTNSKAIDFKKASSNTLGKTLSREQLNDLFATISETNSPSGRNYNNGFVFTRLWLEQKGYIDEYGLNKNTSQGNVARFIYDCTIRSFTNRTYKSDTEYAALPEEKAFITNANGNVTDTAIKAEAKKVANENFTKLYDKYQYINFGIKDRGTVDLALWEDTSEVNIEINGEKRKYKYGKRSKLIEEESKKVTGDGDENDLDRGGYSSTFFDVITRQGAGYYNNDKNSTQNLYKSDYNYKLNMYGKNVNKDVLSELRVYITYELKVKNQSSLFYTNVDEVLNYYDSKSLRFIPERSYFDNEDEKIIRYKEDGYKITGTDTTNVNSIGNCTSMTIINFGLLKPGETKKAYLTFEVVKTTDGKEGDESPIIKDEKGGGWLVLGNKVNLSEIGKYTTYYAPGAEVPNVEEGVGGKVAGIVDRDSVPGNCYSCNNTNQGVPYLPQEDDTDMAPLLTLQLYENKDRSIIGTSFEDLRTTTNNEAVIGNGVKDGSDPNINGVTVQLVELFSDGSEYIWREFGDNTSRNKVKEYTEEGSGFEIGWDKTIGKGTGTGSDNKCTIVTTNLNPIYYNDVNQGTKAATQTKNIESGTGMYGFNGIPAGTYVVRFRYGDTTRTVLVSNSSEDVQAHQVSDKYGKYGENVKSYNGQDYKSTTYQASQVGLGAGYNYKYEWKRTEKLGDDIVITPTSISVTTTADTYYNQNTTGSYVYNIRDASAYTTQSDAKDLKELTSYQGIYDNNDSKHDRVGTREDVKSYSDENVTNALSKVLAASKLGQNYANNSTIKQNVDNLIKETSMTADTGLIEFKIENDDLNGTTEDHNPNLENTGFDQYEIGHVNLGLEERPKSQIDLSKDVQNVRVTLADGTVMFDASQKSDNVLWTPNIDETANYESNASVANPNTPGLINQKLNRDINMNDEDIRKNTLEYLKQNIQSHKGLIQLTMDEELMHGARLEVVYKINVFNIGEVDYKDYKFYYTGIEDSPDNYIVTTRIDKIIDYIPNNMRFEKNAQENVGIWRVISSHSSSNPELTRTYTNSSNDPIQLVDGELLTTSGSTISSVIDKYNTVIELISKSDFSENPGTPPSRITNIDLVPELYHSKINGNKKSSEFDFLVLSQTISPENKSDDLTYRNIAEIVRYDNTVGRRMEWSVTGNQNPEADPQELDTDRGETITILPPFGELSNYTNLIVSITIIVSCVILGVGIVFIKRKVIT